TVSLHDSIEFKFLRPQRNSFVIRRRRERRLNRSELIVGREEHHSVGRHSEAAYIFPKNHVARCPRSEVATPNQASKVDRRPAEEVRCLVDAKLARGGHWPFQLSSSLSHANLTLCSAS